jgi:hypothetical protein
VVRRILTRKVVVKIVLQETSMSQVVVMGKKPMLICLPSIDKVRSRLTREFIDGGISVVNSKATTYMEKAAWFVCKNQVRNTIRKSKKKLRNNHRKKSREGITQTTQKP